MMLRLKLKKLGYGQCQLWAFQHSRASNSKTNCTIWPKFKFFRKFMPVHEICKFDKVARIGRKTLRKLQALCPGQCQLWAI